MNFKPINSVFLITLTVLGMILTIGLAGHIPSIPPIIPDAHASPPNNPAVLGLFSEAKKSSAVVDPAIGAAGVFNMDVNVTDAGQIKGFDINITFTSTTMIFFNSTFTGLKCPGCIFQTVTTSLVSNATATCVTAGCTATGNPRAYRLSVVDADSGTPFVNGNGVLFRVAFRVQAASVASVIHIETSKSVIQNPSPVQYNAVDGYFDNRGASASNFGISESPITLTIVRPILNTTLTSPAITVSLTAPVNVNQAAILLSALGLPKNSTASFSACTPAPCISTLTITIRGGSKTASSTTPSGTFSIPIIGDTTGTGVSGRVIRATWFRLVIQPPAAPVYTFSTSTPKVFTQQAGNWTAFTLSVTLTSGANDSIVFGNNCNQKTNAAGDCKIVPGAGHFPLTAVMNFSSFTNGALGTYRFNVTAITQGTYSEIIKTQNITFTLNLRRDHDLRTDNVAYCCWPGSPRTSAYTGINLALANQLQTNVTVSNLGTLSETFQINSTAKVLLVPANGLVAANQNLRWVDYPYVGQVLKTDPKIKFIGPGATWAIGNTVVYDSNNNGVYDTGEPVISGSAVNGAVLKTDPKIKYIDLNGDNVWSSGIGFPSSGADFEPVIYDTNNNNVYDTGESIILGANNYYDKGETAVNDLDGNGLYGVGKIDSNLRFVDANSNSHWDPGETVIYDTDASFTYTTGDIVVVGTAPALNTALSFDGKLIYAEFFNYPTYFGGDSAITVATPAIGATLKTDPRIKFVGPGFSWASGNSVVYDTNNNGLYDTGEPVIAGPTPTVGTALKFDPFIKFSDPTNNAWVSGDPVAYDLNNNNLFDQKDSVYYDTNGNGVFDGGETIVFGTAPQVEPVLAGKAVALGTVLGFVSTLSFVDSNYNGVFYTQFTPTGFNSTIVFDANNNGVYDNSDVVVRGTSPSGGLLLGTRTVTVAAGLLNQKFTISWDPGVLPQGTYIIAGAAVPVTGEFNLGNNQVIFTSNTFTQKLKGDVNGDCLVDITDLALVGSFIGFNRGQPGYSLSIDLNNDGAIDVTDLALVGGTLGSKCSGL